MDKVFTFDSVSSEHLQVAYKCYSVQLLALYYGLDSLENGTWCQCACSFHVALDSWQDL